MDPGSGNGQTRACMREWVLGLSGWLMAKPGARSHTPLSEVSLFHLFDVNVDNFGTTVIELLST